LFAETASQVAEKLPLEGFWEGTSLLVPQISKLNAGFSRCGQTTMGKLLFPQSVKRYSTEHPDFEREVS